MHALILYSEKSPTVTSEEQHISKVVNKVTINDTDNYRNIYRKHVRRKTTAILTACETACMPRLAERFLLLVKVDKMITSRASPCSLVHLQVHLVTLV